MNSPHLQRLLQSTTIVVLMGLAVGCAGRAGPAAAPASPAGAATDESAMAGKPLEPQRLVAMLRSLRLTSHAYDRMTEARSTIIDAVSWWAVITPASPATPSPAPAADATQDAAQASDDGGRILEPPADPYAAIDEASATAAAPPSARE